MKRAILFLFLLCACTKQPPQDSMNKMVTVLLHDMSASVAYDSTHVQHFVSELISERMTSQEDVLYRLPVGDKGYDAYSVKAYRLDLSPFNDPNMGDVARSKAMKSYNLKKEAVIETFSSVVTPEFLASGTALKTQILASLPMVQTLIEQSQANDFVLVIQSDMWEDGDIRNLKVSEFQNLRDVKEAAEQDVKQLSQLYGLSQDGFAPINDVVILLPSCQKNDATNSGLVMMYWKTVFTELGCANVNIYNECK